MAASITVTPNALWLLRVSVVFLFLFVSFTTTILAQDKEAQQKEPWSFGTNGYYGVLFRYREGLPPINATHPVGVEVYANKHTLGRRQWERQYNYPQVGFAFSYYNYSVPLELGEAYSLTAYLDKSIIERKRGSLRFNVGTGLVYSTRHYITAVNELNKAIGSRVSFALRGTMRYEVPVNENLYLNLNLAFRHFSNGGMNKPNNGMNFPMLGVGVRYQPLKVETKYVTDTLYNDDKRIHFNLKLATGMREVLYEDVKHPVHVASFYVSKKLSEVNAVLLGGDVLYDTSLEEEFIKEGYPLPEEELDANMAGITVGHELYLGKLSFVFQFGRYIHQPYKFSPDYYQRYGLKYLLTPNVSASAMLLAHTKKAYVVEWGLGFHL